MTNEQIKKYIEQIKKEETKVVAIMNNGQIKKEQVKVDTMDLECTKGFIANAISMIPVAFYVGMFLMFCLL